MPFSPEPLLTLSPPSLRALVAAFAPKGVAHPSRPGEVLPSTAAPRFLVRALFTAAPAPKLGQALDVVQRFGSSPARLALVEAGRACGDARAEAWLRERPSDLAAALVIERATGKPRARRAAERLLALASHRLERDLPARPTYELAAERPVADPPSELARSLTRKLRNVLVEVWEAADPDGTLRLALFLLQPSEARLVKDDAGRAAVRAAGDEVVVDLVRVLPGGARVAITTATPELLPAYAAALSLSLGPSFTLRPLHDMTAARLAALAMPRVSRVDVVGLRLRRPDGARVEVRASDALDPSLHAEKIGYVDRATVRMTIDGARIDAFLHLPYRLELAPGPHEAPARAALTALGLFAPGSLPDDARSLAPYEHPEWRWRSVLSAAAFDRLRRVGLLREIVAAHVVTPEHRMHGAAYVVRDVPGEKDVQYAFAEDRSLGASLVGQEDRVAWRLDLEALAGAFIRDLGAARAEAPLGIAGALDLGVVALPSGKIRFVYLMSEPPAAWQDMVRRSCGLGVTPVAIVPRGRGVPGSGIMQVEVDLAQQLGASDVGRVLGRAAEALGVGSEVEAWRRFDEELVMEEEARRVWLSGTLVRLKDRAFGLVLALAKSGGKVVATKDAGIRISGAGSPDVTARKAKAEAEQQIAEALEASGADTEIVGRLIVAEGRRGYRMGVSVRVV
jgi:hypothetical protein